MRVLHVCMHTLYGYCMSMYWTLPMTVLYACVWQRVGPVGVAGYYRHRSPVHVALASLYGRGGREM